MGAEKYGRFEIIANIEEEGLYFTYIKYWNSREIIKLGGMYCLWCEDTGNKKFFRNDYMAMHALSKFIRDNVREYEENNN